MRLFQRVFFFYYDGFKNMKLGKTLWKVVLIKIFVILVFLNHILYQKSFKTEYETFEQKSEFVIDNLLRSK